MIRSAARYVALALIVAVSLYMQMATTKIAAGFLHMIGSAWNLVMPDGDKMLARCNRFSVR